MITIPRELEVQGEIEKLLEKRKLYPFNVFYTSSKNNEVLDGGTLAISFFLRDDLEELLKIIDYYSLCNRSCYIVIPEYNTLIITSGSSIIDLWSKL